jgi:transcriptional regulator with XRE-family HTH domain
MDDPPSFGRLLRERRKTNDLTQEQLAEQVHCSIETIKKLEAGKLRPSKHLAELLATQLALPPTDRVTFITAARAELHGSHLPPQPANQRMSHLRFNQKTCVTIYLAH